MIACLLTAIESESFAHFHCDACCILFFQPKNKNKKHTQKQFRYAARFAFLLTATDQLH